MGLKRAKANAEINKDIEEYWKDKKITEEDILYYIRKGLFKEIGKFEELQEHKIQNLAHRMIPKIDLNTHADRLDIKRSLRRYMRKNVIMKIGMQKYFPELFSDDEKKNTT